MIYNAIVVMLLLSVALPSGATKSVTTLEPVIEIGMEENSVRTKVVDKKDHDDRGILSFLSWIKEKVKKKVYAWLGISDNDEKNRFIFWLWVISLFLAGVFFILGTYTYTSVITFGLFCYLLGFLFGGVGLAVFLAWVVWIMV